MTKLVITRKKALRVMLKAQVILDGELKGNIKNGETIYFEVEDGKHTVQTQISFGIKSEIKEIEVVEGRVTQVEIIKSPRFMKYYRSHVYPILIPAMLLIFIAPLLGNITLRIIGFSALCVAYIFVIKANKVLFDIEEV